MPKRPPLTPRAAWAASTASLSAPLAPCAFAPAERKLHAGRSAMGKVAIGALGLLAAPASALSASGKRTEAEILSQGYKPRRRTEQPLLPAGAQSLRHFAASCTGCQACVAACPSQVLASFDHGAGLLQPSLSFHHGFCRTSCTVCGQVCPAGAIQQITPEEKSAIQIGHAEIDRSLCVVKTDQVACTACQRNCPFSRGGGKAQGACGQQGKVHRLRSLRALLPVPSSLSHHGAWPCGAPEGVAGPGGCCQKKRAARRHAGGHALLTPGTLRCRRAPSR